MFLIENNIALFSNECIYLHRSVALVAVGKYDGYRRYGMFVMGFQSIIEKEPLRRKRISNGVPIGSYQHNYVLI